jgi:hypothetical protein
MIGMRKMSKKRICLTVLLSFLCVSFLSSQSLVELAKKEKERRAKLKGKTTVVVTNASLRQVKKTPAVTIHQPLFLEEEPVETPSAPAEVQEEAPPAPEETPAEEVIVDLTSLEDNVRKAEEYVGLLTLKMNGLWQEFYSLDDMTSRDQIQQEISTTYLQLQKAQQDAENARNELDQARRRR